jgi:hypothetical protein
LLVVWDALYGRTFQIGVETLQDCKSLHSETFVSFWGSFVYILEPCTTTMLDLGRLVPRFALFPMYGHTWLHDLHDYGHCYRWYGT